MKKIFNKIFKKIKKQQKNSISRAIFKKIPLKCWKNTLNFFKSFQYVYYIKGILVFFLYKYMVGNKYIISTLPILYTLNNSKENALNALPYGFLKSNQLFIHEFVKNKNTLKKTWEKGAFLPWVY